MSINRLQNEFVASGEEAGNSRPAGKRLLDLMPYLERPQGNDLVVALPFQLKDLDLMTIHGVAGNKALLIDDHEDPQRVRRRASVQLTAGDVEIARQWCPEDRFCVPRGG